MSNTFDFEAFKANAIEQLKSGVPLSGKDGVLAPLLENLLNSALEGEMDSHLDNGERDFGNRRNGHISKQVRTSMGEVTISTPRDRDGTFDPQVVRKREKILADSLADRIIGLYAIGTSTREISDILEEQFGNRISAETISSITDRVLPEIQSWKSRPLDPVYPIVWLDAVHYKVMDEKNRPVCHLQCACPVIRGQKGVARYVHIQKRGRKLLAECPDRSPKPRRSGHTYRLRGRSQGFPRCDS